MKRRATPAVIMVVAAVAVVVVLVVALRAGLDGNGSAVDGADGEPAAGAEVSGVSFDTAGWRTDFSKHSAPLEEFISGGPPRDGIPPLDDPTFVAVGAEEINDREPVVAIEIDGQARAYPLQILIWHEIVNDELAGRKVAVTFCPLCYTAVAFDRMLDGRELTFGTTGNLRFSDLVMWDRQTETWWQQFSGEAVVGELTGKRLDQVPAQLISMGEFASRYPDGQQLSRDTGHDRPYGDNPYQGYDDVDQPPFLLEGAELDQRLQPKARVVTVEGGRDFVAVPFAALREQRVINAKVGPLPFVAWWRPGTTSALNASTIRDSDDVGSAVVLDRRVDGRVLTFEEAGDTLRDRETGTTWNAAGEAVEGALLGERLRRVPHDAPFWFAVGAFRPDARIVDA